MESRWIVSLLIALLLGSSAKAEVRIPNQFRDGDRARAEDINQNFEALRSATAGLEKRLDELSQALQQAHPHSIKLGQCREVEGDCGLGMYNQPTLYFDRVRFQCPKETPVLTGFRFVRCGQLNQPQEGLRVDATCCVIAN